MPCSDTKAGRATVIKTIGEDGDAVISAMYEATKAGECRPRSGCQSASKASRWGVDVPAWDCVCCLCWLSLNQVRVCLPVSGEKVAKSLKKTAIRLMLKVGINWHDGAFADQVRGGRQPGQRASVHSRRCDALRCLLVHRRTCPTAWSRF